MTLYAELESRGIIKQVTDPLLSQRMNEKKLTLYCGFDPTSDSLHVGSLLPLLTLKRFQQAGHKVIVVVGGATGMIGDPSGKSQERNLLSDEQIQKNLYGISSVVSRILATHGENAAKICNNADWFKGLSYLEFLRDVGKHFTVNHMVAKESVRARLEDREHGISYTEFSYMLLQAYDFYHLHSKDKCDLQVGGSDQWGNITAGIELIRRMNAKNAAQETEVFGLTHPLVMKADGAKFGKTEAGTVWLDPVRTSPYEFYQFFVQTADADVLTYLNYFTFLSLSEIKKLEQSIQSAPEKREAQLVLAREMTRLIHGEEELKRAEGATQALFGSSIRELDEKTLLNVMKGAPSTNKKAAELGITAIDLLVETGLCSSKGAARKDMSGGGIYINNERASDPAAVITSKDLIADRYVVLRKGKKTYHLVSFL